MISEEQKQELKKKLEAEGQRLRKSLNKIGKKDEDIKSVENYDAKFPKLEREAGKQEDNVVEVEGYLTRIGEETNLEETLNKVEKALERMEQGTYGKCSKCEGDIPLKRLEAVPEAASCTECK